MVELRDQASKKGKGQLPILFGFIYRGAYQHIRLDAGGNGLAQLKIVSKGVVTTSEKYTITLSAHTTVHNVIVTWDNLNQRPEDLLEGSFSQPRTPPEASQPPEGTRDFNDEQRA